MKTLLEGLLKVDLAEDRVKVLDVGAMGSAYSKDSLRAIWWYNLNKNMLEYSEAATSHLDRKVFKGPFEGEMGWVRGRVFEHKEKYFIVVYLEDWLDWPLTNKSIAELYRQIQDKSDSMISNVVDEEGRSLAENKK